jgi:hypothetical protein
MSSRISRMHWLIIGWMGIGTLFVLTFIIAMWRVSQTPKFTGQAFNSLDCAGKSLPDRQVITAEMCAKLRVAPLPAK